MKQRRITRRKGRLFWVLGLLCFGALGLTSCNPYYALQRTLSPLGFAWYGDLLRLRTLHTKMPRKLTNDRWRRAVGVTVLAIRRYGRKHKWTPQQTRLGLLRFARELASVSRRAREPYARRALAGIFQSWGKHRAMAWPFLLSLLSDDVHPLVRKRAFDALLLLRPTRPWLQRATHRTLHDTNYWVRSGVLFAFLPAIIQAAHPLHDFAFEALSLCAVTAASPPRKENKPRPDLLLRLRTHCLRAMAYVNTATQPKAIAFVQTLVGRNDALAEVASVVLARLKAPIIRPQPLGVREPPEPPKKPASKPVQRRRPASKPASRPAARPATRP